MTYPRTVSELLDRRLWCEGFPAPGSYPVGNSSSGALPTPRLRGMAMAPMRGRPLTYDDLQELPDDGHRYELVDGQLLVSPSPIPRHQICVSRLWALLDAVVPDGLVALPAPVDWVVSPLTVFIPDVVVTTVDDVTGKRLTRPPFLVAEVFSPSTRLTDLGTKRLAYARAGVEHYWLVDPEVPALTMLRLNGDDYTEVARVTGGSACAVTEPFTLTVTPDQLLGPLGGTS